MIKKLASIFIIYCFILLSGIPVQAATQSWNMKRVVGERPIFPDNAEYALQHSCYALDEAASISGEKLLYLTFDSGYENGNTSKILDVLKEKDVPATFFILKLMIEKENNLVKRMIADGHTVANHTKNHKNLTKLTDEEIKMNLQELEVLALENLEYNMPTFFRYPEGRYDSRTVECLEKLGYKTFFWSLAYADWDNNNQPSCNVAVETLTKFTHPGAIVLLHPTSATNAEILPTLIDRWRDMGYSFGKLEDLIKRNEAV